MKHDISGTAYGSGRTSNLKRVLWCNTWMKEPERRTSKILLDE
jgi:hypothetical protein